MPRIARLAVLLAAVASLLGAVSGAAGAVTWHNSGDTAFTATAGPFTYSATTAALNCGSATATATAGPTPSVGITWSGISLTATWNSCTLSGQTFGWDCRHTFTATSQSGAVTSGTLDTACEMYQFGTLLCRLNGTLSTSYDNPSGSVPGRFTVATGGTLRTSNGATGTCPLGSNDLVHLSAMTYTITAGAGGPAPHLGPVITRTA